MKKIWQIFTSPKLAVALLVLITAFSVLGTLIPQNAHDMYYALHYGNRLARLMRWLQFDRIYTSWTLGIPLLLLAINLVCCTFKRGVRRWHQFGFVLTHLSVLVILLGGFIHAHWYVHGFLELTEGESASRFRLAGQSEVKYRELPFAVKLSAFSVERYPERLVVAVYEVYDRRVAHRGFVPVRKVPSDWYDLGGGQRLRIVKLTSSPEEHIAQVEVESGSGVEEIGLEWRGGGLVRPVLLRDGHTALALGLRQGGDKEYLSRVEIREGGKVVTTADIRVNQPLHYAGWNLYQYSYHPDRPGTTVLEVSRDPGLWVVYAGFTLLALGVCFIFYVKPFLRKVS